MRLAEDLKPRLDNAFCEPKKASLRMLMTGIWKPIGGVEAWGLSLSAESNDRAPRLHGTARVLQTGATGFSL